MGRFKEVAKNILIIVLLISVSWLTYKTWVYDPSVLPASLYEKAAKIMSYIGVDISVPGAVTVETRRVHDTIEAAGPVRCAIKLAEGRYGAEYDSTLVSQVYDKTKRLIGEAIGSASEPTEISQGDWRKALGHTGIYYDYLTDIPMSAIAIWQNYEPSPYSTSGVRHLILAADGDSVGLYYTSSKKGRFQYSRTAVSLKDLAEILTDYSPNGCVLAFEDATTDPEPMDELFLFEGQPIRMASAYKQSHEDVDFDELLKSFDMSLSAARYTQSTDNTVIAVDRARTLTLSENGEMVYSDSGEDKSGEFVIYVSRPTEAEIIETVRVIAEHTAGPLSGDAEIGLVRFEHDKDKDEYIVGFDYTLNGVPVKLTEFSNAATFRIDNGVLVYAHVQLRSFVLKDETYQPMPIKTAIVLAGEGADCGLCYSESGSGDTDTLDIGWYSR